MRYDVRQVHSVIQDLRLQLGAAEEARLLAQRPVPGLTKKLASIKARQQVLDAELSTVRKQAEELGLSVDGSRDLEPKKEYNSRIPEASLKTPRVQRFLALERAVRTAMVGGDRKQVQAALEALTAHVDKK
jgi:hypothetical protein